MTRDSTQALLAGGLSAALVVPLASHPFAYVVVGWFLALPLFWATWGLGRGAGTIAAMTAVAGCGLLMGPAMALAHGFFIVFPAWLGARQLLFKRPSPTERDRWYPLGEGFARVVVYFSALLVAVLAGIASGLDEGVLLTDALVKSLREQVVFDLLGGNRAAAAETIALFRSLGPGLGVAMLVAMSVASALMARSILVRQGRNASPAFKTGTLVLPESLGWLWVSTGVVALATDGNIGFIADNVFVVIAAAYFFQGLDVIHDFVANRRQRALILCGTYLMMAIIGWVVVLIMALGLFENWNGIRNRGQRQKSSGGDVPNDGEE